MAALLLSDQGEASGARKLDRLSRFSRLVGEGGTDGCCCVVEVDVDADTDGGRTLEKFGAVLSSNHCADRMLGGACFLMGEEAGGPARREG